MPAAHPRSWDEFRETLEKRRLQVYEHLISDAVRNPGPGWFVDLVLFRDGTEVAWRAADIGQVPLHVRITREPSGTVCLDEPIADG